MLCSHICIYPLIQDWRSDPLLAAPSVYVERSLLACYMQHLSRRSCDVAAPIPQDRYPYTSTQTKKSKVLWSSGWDLAANRSWKKSDCDYWNCKVGQPTSKRETTKRNRGNNINLKKVWPSMATFRAITRGNCQIKNLEKVKALYRTGEFESKEVLYNTNRNLLYLRHKSNRNRFRKLEVPNYRFKTIFFAAFYSTWLLCSGWELRQVPSHTGQPG